MDVRKRLSGTIAWILLSLLLTPASTFADSVACYFFYNPSAPQQFIQNAKLSDLARLKGEWFEIIVPQQNGERLGFEYKLVSNWRQVEESFEGISFADRGFVKIKLDEYVKGFRNVAHYFSIVAKNHGAGLKTRIKDIHSLRNKIIDRAKAYLEMGKVFTFERLDDFIGVRLMLNPDSELLAQGDPESPEVRRRFAKQLGFANSSAIEKIEFKGGSDDQAKERYYRATHITVRMPDGIPVEVQLMSKSTAIWHQWDHPKVYKATTTNPWDKSKLKYYSTFWIRIINTIEDGRGTISQTQALTELLELYGFNQQSTPLPNLKGSSWLNDLDESMANWLGLPPADRFLGKDSALSPLAQRQLFRQLELAK